MRAVGCIGNSAGNSLFSLAINTASLASALGAAVQRFQTAAGAMAGMSGYWGCTGLPTRSGSTEFSPAQAGRTGTNMIENRVLTMDDYLAMLRRRLKVILIPTLLAPLVGFAISYAFPPKYTSHATVLVEEQRVPQGYVAAVVTEDLTQRIATLEQKALGADRLRPLIDKLNQQGILRGNVDETIEQIRSQISIEPVQMVVVPNPTTTTASKRPGLGGSSKTPQVPGFNVDYTASNAREAQAVCAGLTEIILQQNLRDRE